MKLPKITKLNKYKKIQLKPMSFTTVIIKKISNCLKIMLILSFPPKFNQDKCHLLFNKAQSRAVSNMKKESMNLLNKLKRKGN